MPIPFRLVPLAFAVGLAGPVFAQPVPGDPPQTHGIAYGAMPFEQFIGPPGDNVTFIRAEDGFETKLVKGAPYQAEAVTEVVQTLSDGNRIVRKTTSAVFRDSEGRTRREHSLAAVGLLVPADGPARTVFIDDPVAGTSYVLEPEGRVARRLPGAGPKPLPPPGPGSPGDRVFAWTANAGPIGGGARKTRRLPKPKVEALGTQTIEGVEADGTRTRFTIAPGEIGNERAIEVTSERWYSPQLQAVVLSRHSDPRLGETTYRLTGVNRSEPDRALFEVPSDYTVTEAPVGPGAPFRKVFRKDP